MIPINQLSSSHLYSTTEEQKKESPAQSNVQPLHSPQDSLLEQLCNLEIDYDTPLPNLENQQLEEIHTFLNQKRFTLNFSVSSFIDEILQEIGQGAKAEIIGGYVRWIIQRNKSYCENALKVELEDVLFQKELEYPSDWDIKITLKKGTCSLHEALGCITRKLGEKGKYLLNKKCVIDTSENQFAIINYEDLEIILVLEQERDRVFEHEGLKLPFPIKRVIGSKRELIDLITHTIHIKDIESVNQHGWPRLLSCKVRGYRCGDAGIDSRLFQKVIKNLDSEDVTHGKICQLLNQQLGNHHSNNILSGTALYFQASYSLKEAGVSTCKLWQNFSSWTRIPSIRRANRIAQDKENLLQGIHSLLMSDPNCFDALSALLEIAGFCSLGKGVFSLTKDGGKSAISMQLPSNHTLLLPHSPLEALTVLEREKIPLEKKSLYFFRKVIKTASQTICKRELPFEDKLVEYAKRFLKDPRKLIREIGFELLLMIEENSGRNTHTPQILYELSKRKHSYKRVTQILDASFVPNPYHTPSQWIESLIETNHKMYLRVACQIWSEIPKDLKFQLGIPLCQALLAVDHALGVRIFRRLHKLENGKNDALSTLLCQIVRTFNEAELAGALPTIVKVSKQLTSVNQSREFTQTLIYLQKKFGSVLSEPVINFKAEWNFFHKVRSASNENLSALYRLINDKRFSNVCEDRNEAYLKFLMMAQELGIDTHRSTATKILTLFMQNRGCAVQIYYTLRDLWNPSFPLPKRAQKELVNSAQPMMSDLRKRNEPEILCQLSLLLENYGVPTTTFADDLIWGITKILPHQIGKAVLKQICRNPNCDSEVLLEIALRAKDANIALKLLKQLSPDEKQLIPWLDQLASIDFDLAATHLSHLQKKELLSPEGIRKSAQKLTAYSENGSPGTVAHFYLDHHLKQPPNLSALLIDLTEIGRVDSLSLIMVLAATYQVNDPSIWVHTLEKLLPMASNDETLCFHSAYLLVQFLKAKPDIYLNRLLSLGVYTLKQLENFDVSRAFGIIYELSTTLIATIPNCPDSVHIIQVRKILQSAVILGTCDANQTALEVFIKKYPQLNRECVEEVIACLLALTGSTEGRVLFGDYLPKILIKVGGRGSQLFFLPTLNHLSCSITLNEHNSIHPNFKKFRTVFYSFMIGILEKALATPFSPLTDQNISLYDFSARNLRNLIAHSTKPSPQIAELIRSFMYSINPSKPEIFQQHITLMKSILHEAVRMDIFDHSIEHLSECIIFVEHKVTLSKPLPPQKQKHLLNAVIDHLLSHKTAESVVLAGHIFQGTHRFIFEDERNSKKYDHNSLFSAYKKIIDASTNFPYIAVDNLPVFDHIFGICFTEKTFIGLDGTREGMRSAENIVHYLISSNIDLYKNTNWPENAHFKKSSMLEFMMKTLKMVETQGLFKCSHQKYFKYIKQMCTLFTDDFDTYTEVLVKELISVAFDLIAVRNPTNKTSFKKIPSSAKKLQMQALLNWINKLKKIATPQQMKIIKIELNILISSDSFFKGHANTLKKIKKLIAT